MIVTKKSAADEWLVCPRPNPGARLRLFCFPYAGGKALTYKPWPEGLPAAVEVWAVRPPGVFGGPRRRPFTSLAPMVEEVAAVIRPSLDKPFAFFGHSMGALFGFELARLLRRSGGPSPVHLFASGRRAPQIPDTLPPTYNLPDAEFLEELRRLNGTPREVLEHPELLELMIPHLRADFEVVQTYVYAEGPPLDIPISAYGGLEDEEVSVEDLEGWREQTTAAFSLRMFPGDHFFIETARPLLLGRLSEELSRLHLGGAPGRGFGS
jgi:medium-chain acyl-[acyl-carrier-protein] hydrolase